MKQYKVFVVANLIFGVLLIVLTKLILPVCHPIDGGTMSCEISTTVDAFLGLALLANAVVAAGLLKKKAHVILSAVTLVVGVFVLLVPTVIVGTCQHDQMACHVITGPVLAVFGVLIALLAALNLIYLKLRRRNEQD